MSSEASMDRMLTYSGGNRKVPVIVDRERVVIGYNGNG